MFHLQSSTFSTSTLAILHPLLDHSHPDTFLSAAQVLPSILAYPTISLMTLAIRDPESFYHPTTTSSSTSSFSSSDEPSSSSSSITKATTTPAEYKDKETEHKPRLPHLDELRLFTGGSDSGDLVERCLGSGKVLVSFPLDRYFYPHPACLVLSSTPRGYYALEV